MSYRLTYNPVIYYDPISGDEADADSINAAKERITADVIFNNGSVEYNDHESLIAIFPTVDDVKNFLTLFLFSDRGESVQIIDVNSDEEGFGRGSDGSAYAIGRVEII